MLAQTKKNWSTKYMIKRVALKKGQNSYLIFIFHPLITYYYKIYFFPLDDYQGGGGDLPVNFTPMILTEVSW